MRIPTSRDRETLSDGNTMTPMIDIVFLLLIFFVCASVGAVREDILPTKLSAGTVSAADPVDREVWVTEIWVKLTTDADEKVQLALNDRPLDSFDQLIGQLLALADVTPDSPVILDIGPLVTCGDYMRAYDFCVAANFESIHFATDPGKTGSAKN